MTTTDDLVIDGHHVAMLTTTHGDFPWAHGTYTPGAAAALLSSGFVERPDGRRELDLDRLAAAGHAPATLRLDDDTYLHALVVASDGTASWRIGVDPLDADD